MKVVYATEAKDNIAAIGEWIARDDPTRAASFLIDLRTACEDLADFPNAYPVLETDRDPPARKRVHGSYLILYEVADVVRILAVRHGARDPDRIPPLL